MAKKSSHITITFPDGKTKQYAKGTTGLDIAKDISEGLAKKILAAKINNEVWDATRPINNDANLKLLSWDDKEGKAAFWHSSAHLMAEALEKVFPGVKFGIGPPIEDGFYYDIDPEGRQISHDDLPKIEKKMIELAAGNNTYQRQEISKPDATKYFKKKGDQYKLELIDELKDGEITFYSQGDFIDLCRGPHIPHTGHIKAIKLLNIAGAYWRGDEKNKQLTRIYGITFPKQKELVAYLEMLEEAKKRDHRKLGKELGLFMFSEKVGSGLPLWLPKGTIVRDTLVDFLKNEQLKRNYLPVITPHIGKKDLYVTSGHYEKFGQDSFQPIHTPHEGEEYLLKPMNCPHHCEIYKHESRSYKDLPLRIAEFGTVYRYEQSGELNGLTRVRSFTVDDAHIFCRPDQVKDEFIAVMDLVMLVFNKLGFSDFTVQISLRDPNDKEKYIGSDENWEKAENAIMEAAESKKLNTITEIGEAAFYGPKLDFMVKDALERSWQLGTIQVDYNLPERFELEFIGEDNKKHQPVMIHRAPFGSMERFMGVLIEHCAGNFPLWLAPIQTTILPISEKFIDYAESILNHLKNCEIRCSIDNRNEKIGKKIRDAEVNKIPIMLIIGEKEMNSNNLSVRVHGDGDKGVMSKEVFIDFFQTKLDESSI